MLYVSQHDSSVTAVNPTALADTSLPISYNYHYASTDSDSRGGASTTTWLVAPPGGCLDKM
eukprot:scaffold3999_cov138-Skeletonema_dohrnii-CCMP3373.AAC.6